MFCFVLLSIPRFSTCLQKFRLCALVNFAGWRKVESYESGTITVWSKEDVPPAKPIPSDAMPTALEGLLDRT